MPASLFSGELARQPQALPVYQFHWCVVTVLLRGPQGEQKDGEGVCLASGMGQSA